MEDNSKLERGLKPRHVEMIALGGTIGVACSWGQPVRFRLPSVSSALLCISRPSHVLYYAYYGRNALLRTGNRLLCYLRS